LYKIAENESPIPLDRVFASYNFYNHIAGDLDTLHRWGVGGEKTFLDGRASFGLRLPFYRFTMDEGGSKSGVGDLTMILKYALLDRPAGVLSAGLAVTAPTSDADIIWLPDGRRVHSTLWQPYVGYVWRREAWFVQGFSSVMLPADAADVKVLFNDVGVGRRFECDLGLLRAIVPAVEVHVNTPLNHRGGGSNPRFRDSVDVTGGMTFELGRRVSLGLAAATPVSHPRLFDLEAMVKLNVRF
ncbi:MAG: hypothetical protein HY043_15890, partial [Verrucomicrobia bacterium]|nr:hypothetical protein [Verrucomicrobiota bacterium]